MLAQRTRSQRVREQSSRSCGKGGLCKGKPKGRWAAPACGAKHGNFVALLFTVEQFATKLAQTPLANLTLAMLIERQKIGLSRSPAYVGQEEAGKGEGETTRQTVCGMLSDLPHAKCSAAFATFAPLCPHSNTVKHWQARRKKLRLNFVI